ncbi:MAG: CoA transferase [Chloroflexi bacterium]|nr:CoA transferase [Chloroflexota bacterium]
MSEPSGEMPLSGLSVLECSTILAGPLIATMLADFGAEVLKIEHPRGDPLRDHGYQKDGVPLWWKLTNRNKKTITLTLSHPEGAALFKRLAATADVVIENFRPGTLERWGIGWEVLHALNPRLVMVRVTGFGQDGPYAPRPGFGTLAEAMSGFAAITGEPDGPPTLPPFGLADSICAMAGTWATMIALYHRDARGGVGQMIDMAIYEPILTALGPQLVWYDQLGVLQARLGNRTVNNAPRNTYRTKDGRWVAISTSAHNVAERVMRLVGHPEVIAQAWFQTGRGRAQHADELDAMVGGWIAERDRETVVAEFAQAGAAVAPIYSAADVLQDPHVRARGSVVSVPDPELGTVRMQNVIARLTATPGAVRWAGRPKGADNREVYQERLGLSAAELERLQALDVV